MFGTSSKTRVTSLRREGQRTLVAGTGRWFRGNASYRRAVSARCVHFGNAREGADGVRCWILRAFVLRALIHVYVHICLFIVRAVSVGAVSSVHGDPV